MMIYNALMYGKAFYKYNGEERRNFSLVKHIMYKYFNIVGRSKAEVAFTFSINYNIFKLPSTL